MMSLLITICHPLVEDGEVTSVADTERVITHMVTNPLEPGGISMAFTLPSDLPAGVYVIVIDPVVK